MLVNILTNILPKFHPSISLTAEDIQARAKYLFAPKRLFSLKAAQQSETKNPKHQKK